MQAGKLNHRVELQRSTDSQDAYGAVTPVWTTYARPWAEVKQPTGNQIEKGRTYSDTVTAVISMRFRTDVLASDRIVDGTHTYAIDGIVDPDGNRTETLIYGTERVN